MHHSYGDLSYLILFGPVLMKLGVICYDDGCHLKKYVERRTDVTETSKRLALCNIVVDKMHFRGHIDKWCQENCNPYQLQELKCVGIQLCTCTVVAFYYL